MMRNKAKTVLKEALNEDECRHYWIIQPPGGHTSKGVCKFCGMEKEFYNSWPYLIVDERTVRPAEFTNLTNSEPDESLDGVKKLRK